MTAAIKNIQAQHDADPNDQDKLALTGTAPQPVWVRTRDHGADQFCEFAAHEQGPWHRHGIKWKCLKGTETSLFIIFQLVDVIAVDCDAPVLYSPPFGSSAEEQYCAIPPSDTKVVHHFTVQHHRGVYVDPKIVVTPITEPTEDA